MLDDANLIANRDPDGALMAVTGLPGQMSFEPSIIGQVNPANITGVVITGMGGSALAAEMVCVLARSQFKVPVVVIKGYDLPNFADSSTLVVAISHSGNTEETLSCYNQAKQQGCVLSAIATGGKLEEQALADGISFIRIPSGSQPRMSTVYHLRALLELLNEFSIIDGQLYEEVASSAEWLKSEIDSWSPTKPLAENYAKQLATQAVGKIGMFYGGQFSAPLAYKWKISWNESSKNLAFWNQFPEFNHNEFIGWTSHPIEKPFAVFDIRSSSERARNLERMELSDRMLSGMRPKATIIDLKGDNQVQQMLWGLALADMSSIYLAVLNNVNPVPVALIEKFKAELS